MNIKPLTLPTAAKWLARLFSLCVIAFQLAFFIGEAHGDVTLFVRHPETLWMALLFFGLVAAWRWPLVGAATLMGGLVGFYTWHFIAWHRFPGGPWFFFIASPSLLFIASWALNRKRPNQPSS